MNPPSPILSQINAAKFKVANSHHQLGGTFRAKCCWMRPAIFYWNVTSPQCKWCLYSCDLMHELNKHMVSNSNLFKVAIRNRINKMLLGGGRQTPLLGAQAMQGLLWWTLAGWATILCSSPRGPPGTPSSAGASRAAPGNVHSPQRYQ